MKRFLPDDFMAEIREAYPKRYGGQGWATTKKRIVTRASEGHSWEEILSGTKSYRKFCDSTGKTGTELVKMAQTFYGPGCWFLEDYDIPEIEVKYRRPQELLPEERERDIIQFHEQMKRFGK